MATMLKAFVRSKVTARVVCSNRSAQFDAPVNGSATKYYDSEGQ